MTASPGPTTARRPWLGLLVLGLLALGGAAAGAYFDWRMWHPMSGIVITFGAGFLLVLGALALATRWRPMRPVALGVLAFAIGVFLGQNLGPSRPPVTLADGTLTIALTEPAGAQPISGPASCQLTPDGENFEISGDPNLRLEIGDQPMEERDNVQVALTQGDMWEYGADSRSDGWGMLVTISDTGPFTDDQVPGNVTMTTDRDSAITGEGTQEAGSLSFDGLVMDQEQSPGGSGPIELAGTIEWSCDPIPPG